MVTGHTPATVQKRIAPDPAADGTSELIRVKKQAHTADFVTSTFNWWISALAAFRIGPEHRPTTDMH